MSGPADQGGATALKTGTGVITTSPALSPKLQPQVNIQATARTLSVQLEREGMPIAAEPLLREPSPQGDAGQPSDEIQSFSADDLYQDEEEEDIQNFEQDGEDGASLNKTDGETEDEKPKGLADDSTLYFYGW